MVAFSPDAPRMVAKAQLVHGGAHKRSVGPTPTHAAAPASPRAPAYVRRAQ
jgi:hypothetical protein